MKNLENMNRENEIKEVPIGTTFENTNKELDKDPELEKAEKIIDEWWDTREIKKLNPELAKNLLTKLQWVDELYLDWLVSLDEDTARELAKFEWNYLNLNWLDDLDKNTAEELAKYKWEHFLLGLTDLDNDISEELSNFKWGRLILNELKIIDSDIAMKLSWFKAKWLSLWLMFLDLEIATELVKFQWNSLNLPQLTVIDEDVAKELAKFEWNILLWNIIDLKVPELAKKIVESIDGGDLRLDHLEEITPEIAAELSKHKWWMNLSWLKTINKEIATELAKFTWVLNIDGLEEIDKDTAAELVKCPWILSFRWLKKLDKWVAEELIKYWWWLNLSWLKKLDVDTARVLSTYKWDICLNGLEQLDVGAAKELANHEWTLELNWLTHITKETSLALSKHKWHIELKNLKDLMTPELARQVISYSTWWYIYLYWLTNIDDTIAAELVPVKSKIRTSNELEQKIKDVAKKMEIWKIMDKNIWALEKDIKNLHLNIESINIVYDRKKSVIKSLWQKCHVNNIKWNEMELDWLELQLSLKEWIWLANFKNYIKRYKNKNKILDKKVEYWRDLLNKKLDFWKTFKINGSIIITRKILERYISFCSDDKKMEKIADWLNNKEKK